MTDTTEQAVASTVSEPIGDLCAVLYTDGGCRPSRGIGGWGVHGYFYRDTPAKVGAGAPHQPTAVGYKAGLKGKPDITVLEYVDAFGSLIPESTNQVAELVAATIAFRVLTEKNVRKAHLLMDSKYVLNGLKGGLEKWENAGWCISDGSPLANCEYWQALQAARKTYLDTGAELTIDWVEGHAGDLGNESADRLATRGIYAGRNRHALEEILYTPAAGYWSTKVERNRMFSHVNWYFATQPSNEQRAEDGRHVYYIGDPREADELTGKMISNATFAVLHLKEPDPALDRIRQIASEMGRGTYQGPMLAKLDKVFSAANYEEIIGYGHQILGRDVGRQRVLSSSEDLLAYELRPARLAFHAIEMLESMDAMLREYHTRPVTSRCVYTEITDNLYELSTVKDKTTCKLLPTITSATRTVEVMASARVTAERMVTQKLKLTLGQDLPDRNTLAALAHSSTKVFVVTSPASPVAFRYAVVIESDGNSGIWAGPYSNLCLIPS